MFRKIYNYFNKRNLKDNKYLFLFDEPNDEEFVCFDCETTGLDPKIDDIISIGAVIIKNNTIVSSKKFVRFVKPKTDLQADAIKIHHIRVCDLTNAGDIDNMINKYLKPMLGIKLPNKALEVSAIYHDYKMEIIPQGHIDLRFNTIMDELKIPNFGKHDAFNDALMTSMIFVKLKNLPNVKI